MSALQREGFVEALAISTARIGELERSAVDREVTARKLVEQALRDGERRFRDLADSMPQIVWEADPEGHFDYYNRRWYEFTGRPEGIRGDESWTDVVHPDDQEQCLERWHSATRTGDAYEIEYRLRERTGAYHWFLRRALPVRNHAGHITRWYGTCTNIDASIVANKELVIQNEEKGKRAAELAIANTELAFQNKEKEKRAAELVIANRELVVQNNEKDKRAAELIIANQELAFQNEEKEKRAAELGVANTELAFQNEEKEKRAAELAIANCELVVQNDEKEKRAAELVVANQELAFQNEEKEKRAAELSVANTELAFQNEEKEKRAAELAIANTELAYQNEVKEKRAAELIIANKGLEQFSYIASHDLQEPLRTVANYMQVFEEDYMHLLDDSARRYLQSVNSAVARMSMLVKSLLDFSRLGHSTKLSFVDCKSLVEVVIADLETMIRMANADIELFEMPHLHVYEVEIRQVFQNLIVNAIKFRREGSRPRIEIRSARVAEGWRFSVADNGIGISPVHFERIFDIFQRLHTSEEYEGNGIGLSNCKKIVESHQGTIRVESSPPHGSTFYFTIPELSP